MKFRNLGLIGVVLGILPGIQACGTEVPPGIFGTGGSGSGGSGGSGSAGPQGTGTTTSVTGSTTTSGPTTTGGTTTTGSGSQTSGSGPSTTTTGSGCVPNLTQCPDTSLCGKVPDGCGGFVHCPHVCPQVGGNPNYCNDQDCPSWNSSCAPGNPNTLNTCIGCTDDDPAAACQGVVCGSTHDRCGAPVTCPQPSNPEKPNGCYHYQTCSQNVSNPQQNTCAGCTRTNLFANFCGWSTPKPFEFQCPANAPAECDYYPGQNVWCCPYNEFACTKYTTDQFTTQQCNVLLPGSTPVTCPTYVNSLPFCQQLQSGIFCCTAAP